jgi:hypothetical protein
MRDRFGNEPKKGQAQSRRGGKLETGSFALEGPTEGELA